MGVLVLVVFVRIIIVLKCCFLVFDLGFEVLSADWQLSSKHPR